VSRTIHSRALRALAVAGLLSAATLLAPATTHAQARGPERAFLNTISAISSGAVTADPAPSHTVAGQRALLGKVTPSETRRPILAT
jgi:hypothetical protein